MRFRKTWALARPVSKYYSTVETCLSRGHHDLRCFRRLLAGRVASACRAQTFAYLTGLCLGVGVRRCLRPMNGVAQGVAHLICTASCPSTRSLELEINPRCSPHRSQLAVYFQTYLRIWVPSWFSCTVPHNKYDFLRGGR